MPTQMRRKDLTAGFHRFFLGHALKSPGIPGFRLTFDDERRGIGVKLVNMRPDPAMLGLLKNEGKRIVKLGMGAEPDEFAAPGVNLGLEHIGIFAAHDRIQTVGRHHQIIFGAVFLGAAELGFKPHLHTQFARPCLQDHQHGAAPDARKPVPARHIAHAVMHNGDIVPIGKLAPNGIGGHRVVLLHPRQRIVRQHHAPAKGVIGAVAFQHHHFVACIPQLHRDAKIQTSRATAQTQNFHRALQGYRHAAIQPKQFQVQNL